ncbi:LPS translocon maturation chaperone LptM [Agrilutibacter terrestris]|uniref:LPS translocon maturation chaperone LptM n=1 Tax=Agrilutibacter terrestris TaxID=2865112 RepID=UPI002545CCB3|nr:lipoprotein [Lysobacter terrestris]
MNRIPRLLVIAVALAALAGCGNKGPLMLPSPPADAVQPAESDVAEPTVTEPAVTEPVPAEPNAEPTATPVETGTPVPATPPAEAPPTDVPPPLPDHGDHG